jgi:formylglycine-generating enzyme required for sulfatase activity
LGVTASGMSWLCAAALALGAGEAGPPLPPLPQLPFDATRAKALQQEWARALGREAQFTNSVGMPLVLIPGGRFILGPNGSTYRVTLARPYYLGATEVTLGQYRRFKPGHKVEGADDEFNADDRPAARVSWHDARAFCAWLSDRPEEKAAGRAYVLPTEAQWEWAARAGTTTARYFGDSDKGQPDYSWFNVTYTPNPKHESKGRGRQPVGKLRPNAFGLYDMLGNVWEWCEDRRVDAATGESRDPVMRGGSWRSGAFHCTAVAHDPGDPNLRADHIGFRVACRVGPPK